MNPEVEYLHRFGCTFVLALVPSFLASSIEHIGCGNHSKACRSATAVQLCASSSLLPNAEVRVRSTDVLADCCNYSSSRNCSTVSPASRTIPPRVKALTGLCLGIVSMRMPLD